MRLLGWVSRRRRRVSLEGFSTSIWSHYELTTHIQVRHCTIHIYPSSIEEIHGVRDDSRSVFIPTVVDVSWRFLGNVWSFKAHGDDREVERELVTSLDSIHELEQDLHKSNFGNLKVKLTGELQR